MTASLLVDPKVTRIVPCPGPGTAVELAMLGLSLNARRCPNSVSRVSQ